MNITAEEYVSYLLHYEIYRRHIKVDDDKKLQCALFIGDFEYYCRVFDFMSKKTVVSCVETKESAPHIPDVDVKLFPVEEMNITPQLSEIALLLRDNGNESALKLALLSCIVYYSYGVGVDSFLPNTDRLFDDKGKIGVNSVSYRKWNAINNNEEYIEGSYSKFRKYLGDRFQWVADCIDAVNRKKSSNETVRIFCEKIENNNNVSEKLRGFVNLMSRAQSGDVFAMACISLCYRNGLGVSKNAQSAQQWLQLAVAESCK